MKYSEKLYNIIAELKSYKNSHDLKTKLPSLQAPIDYVLSNTGKMIRPIICYLSHNLYADASDDMYNACWAVEYFHNFTLMHDDIMDDAPTRRGQESSYKRYGSSQTILSGDALNIMAYMYIQKINRDELSQILSSFNRTALDVCEGQQLDVDFEDIDEVAYADYLQMIKLKTASLFGLSAYLGSATATADEEQNQKMYEFGINLGMAFQILDDYLDAFGDEAAVGKQIGGDILMRKKTCAYIKTLGHLEGSAREDFKKLYLQSSPENVAQTIQIMRDAGTPEILHKEIQEYTSRAIQIMDSVDTLSSSKDELLALCNQLNNRNH